MAEVSLSHMKSTSLKNIWGFWHKSYHVIPIWPRSIPILSVVFATSLFIVQILSLFFTYKGNYYKELSYAVIEADEFQDQQSKLESWRLRGANGIILVQIWRLENQEDHWQCSSFKVSG